MELNLQSRVKKTLKITLYDGRVFTVLPPGKKMFDFIREWLDGNGGDESIAPYDMAASVLSHNLEKTTITKEELEEMVDYDDLYEIIGYYYAFCNEFTNLKNSPSPITPKRTAKAK